MMTDGWMGWGWPFGGFFWLVVLGLAIYGVMQLLRAREPAGPADPASGSLALKALDERYARSEIDREEYLRRKRDILGKGEA
jgi:putative membrane protein